MILALGGLAIVTLFAWTRTSRAATERARAADIAIREYADFAARLFAQHTFELSGEVQLRLLRPVLARSAIAPAAPLTVTEFAGAVRRELRRMPPAYDSAVVGFFVVDRTGRLLGTTGDPRTRDVAAAFVTTLGQPPPPEVTDPRFQYRPVGHPELEVLFAETDRDTSGRIYALTFTSRSWRDALGNQSLAELPLLPPSYVDPAIVRPFPMRADSLLTIDVYGGTTVYRSPRSFTGGVAGEFDASNSAGVRIVTTLNPALVADFRQQLLGSPGNLRGPPAATFPLLATLLVLALAAYAWRIRRQNQARRGFVSTVSHEFRTPLAQMRMYTEMLLLGRTRDALESRQWIAIIMREARRLESSVENILFFSHLDALRTRLEREATDIGQLVESVVDGYVPLAEAREMRLLADAPHGMVMSIDPRAVRRMVGNLIDNALAFGPPGQTIRIDVARDGDDIVLSVTDEGPGIPRQQRQRIFQPFDRTDTPVPPGSGTGIGLAVVHGLVRQHGGRIEIRDADGGGASLVVTLPTGATRTRPGLAHDKKVVQQLGGLAVPALLVAIIALSLTTAWNLRSAWRAHLAATDRAIGELAAFGARLVTSGVGAELESVRVLALAGMSDSALDARVVTPEWIAKRAFPELARIGLDTTSANAGAMVQRGSRDRAVAMGALRDSAITAEIEVALAADADRASAQRRGRVFAFASSSQRRFEVGYLRRSDSLVAGFAIARDAAWRVVGSRLLPTLPLLPPWLGDSTLRWKLDPVQMDSLFSVSVADERGHTLFTSRAPFPGSPVGTLDEHATRGLVTSASLHPDLVARLRERSNATQRRSMLLAAGAVSIPVHVIIALLTLNLAAAVAWYLRRQRSLARTRRDFVAAVSHELRTPLAQIRLFTETILLGRAGSDEERDRWLGIISRETRRLGDLLENVLLFAQLDADRARLEVERTDLGELVEEIVEGYVPLAERKGMRLLAEAPSGIVVMVDPRAMRQVVVNLLDNALKYGRTGQVVRIEVTSVHGAAALSIEDEGEGIPPESRDKLFEPFVRLGRSAGTTAGSGIGLSVVRDIVRLHGGRIRIEDGASRGARFVVDLPLALTDPAPKH